jgi:hypothetical protein
MYPRTLKNMRIRDMFMCSSLVRLVQYVPTHLEEHAQTFKCSSLVRLVQYVPTRLEELAHTRHVYV